MNVNQAKAQEAISWDKVVAACRDLADRLRPFRHDQILAVSRGGMVPATILAHLLDIRDIELIHAESYASDREKGEVRLRFTDCLYGQRLLVLDDIVDTAETMRAIRQRMVQHNSVDYAALVIKETAARTDTDITFSVLVSDDTWITFPWEVE